jgi:hypothetical protein
MCSTWTVSVPEVGLVGDWISPRVSDPDVFAKIAVFESFDRRDIGLSAPGGGDIERREGETTVVDRVSLVRETLSSKDVRLFGDFNVIASGMPCCLELPEDDVEVRGSSSRFDGWIASAGRDGVSSLVPSFRWGTNEEDVLGNRVEAGLVLGVRNWTLETACLSTVGMFKPGLVARGDELNERGLWGLDKAAAVADKEVWGLSTVGPADVSLLILFCGSERGDGL